MCTLFHLFIPIFFSSVHCLISPVLIPTIGIGHLSSNSMRRDYYRGSQDSLAIRGELFRFYCLLICLIILAFHKKFIANILWHYDVFSFIARFIGLIQPNPIHCWYFMFHMLDIVFLTHFAPLPVFPPPPHRSVLFVCRWSLNHKNCVYYPRISVMCRSDTVNVIINLLMLPCYCVADVSLFHHVTCEKHYYFAYTTFFTCSYRTKNGSVWQESNRNICSQCLF